MVFGRWMVAMLALTALVLTGCDERGAKPEDRSQVTNEVAPEKPNSDEVGNVAAGQAGTQGQVTDTLWVMESRGTKQCEGGGLTVEQSRGKLADSGIQVVESRCGVRSDRMYPSVCGGATGDILLHRIPTAMLDAALELGFDPVSNVTYEFSSCAPKSGSGTSDI